MKLEQVLPNLHARVLSLAKKKRLGFLRPQKVLQDLYDRVTTDEISRSMAILVLLIILLAIPSLIQGEYFKPEFWENVLAGAYGMVFDLLIFGLFVARLSEIGAKKKQIQQYMNEIDDFRNWEDQVAAHRIRGNIIRLNRLGVSKIDLRLCYLARSDLQGAILTGSKIFKANLENCDLTDGILQSCDCWNTNLTNAIMRNVDLASAKLNGAILAHAILCDANLTGAILHGAMLLDADLSDSVLDNADFSAAKNLDPRQLSRAKSAVNIKLDEELRRQVGKLNPTLFQNGTKLN